MPVIFKSATQQDGGVMTNKPLSLDESHEWAGLWWLPETPENRCRVSYAMTLSRAWHCL